MSHDGKEVVEVWKQEVAAIAWEQLESELAENGEELGRLVWQNVAGPEGRAVEIIEGIGIRADEPELKLAGVITPVIFTGEKEGELPYIRLEVISREGVKKERLFRKIGRGVGQTRDNNAFHYKGLELLVGNSSVEPEALEVTQDGSVIRGLFPKEGLIAAGLKPGDLDNSSPEHFQKVTSDAAREVGRVASIAHQETEPGADKIFSTEGPLRVWSEKPGKKRRAISIAGVIDREVPKVETTVHDQQKRKAKVKKQSAKRPFLNERLTIKLPEVGQAVITKIYPRKEGRTVVLDVHYRLSD